MINDHCGYSFCWVKGLPTQGERWWDPRMWLLTTTTLILINGAGFSVAEETSLRCILATCCYDLILAEAWNEAYEALMKARTLFLGGGVVHWFLKRYPGVCYVGLWWSREFLWQRSCSCWVVFQQSRELSNECWSCSPNSSSCQVRVLWRRVNKLQEIPRQTNLDYVWKKMRKLAANWSTKPLNTCTCKGMQAWESSRCVLMRCAANQGVGATRHYLYTSLPTGHACSAPCRTCLYSVTGGIVGMMALLPLCKKPQQPRERGRSLGLTFCNVISAQVRRGLTHWLVPGVGPN